jgi:hypothetical protein
MRYPCRSILDFLSMFTYTYMALSYDAYLPSYYLRRICTAAYANKQCYHVITLAITQTSQLHLILIIFISAG